MSTETERHAPLTSACDTVMQYPDSNIEHVCRLDHIDGEVHSCTCGLVWRDTSRADEVEQLRAERDALKAELAEAKRSSCGCADADRTYTELEAEFQRTATELAEARAAIHEVFDCWADPFGNWTADQADAARAQKSQMLQRLLAALDTPSVPESPREDHVDSHGRTWDPHPFVQSRAVTNVRVCICGLAESHHIHHPAPESPESEETTDER